MTHATAVASRCDGDPSTTPAAIPWPELNPEQREAVLHGQGPLLVIAGAGTGKTSTLAARVAQLVRGGADPQRVLLLTFSRRAAAEMERRTGRMLQAGNAAAAPPSLPWSGTFHAVGARLLREYAPRIGLSESFTIHDRSDAEDLMAIVRHERGLASTERRFPGKSTCLAIYSRAVNGQVGLDVLLPQAFAWCAGFERELADLFAAYVEEKQAQDVLDYDDLLLYWSYLMQEPALAAEVGARFDHVLVDEYQDTNVLQAAILHGLKPDGRGVTVVGDDAQSIYAFRAATVRNILDFPARFTPPARIVALVRNYRSTQPILDAANDVLALAAEGYAKRLSSVRPGGARPRLVTVRDEADQARAVAERVLAHAEGGIALKAQAVLFRSASHSAALELELARRQIPFVKYGGLKFLEAAHVKDVLAVLRLAENPRGRLAAFRALRLVAGIGSATARQVVDGLAEAADAMASLRASRIPPAARDDWTAFLDVLDALAAEGRWPADMERVLDWYALQLPRLHDDAPVRRGDLAQLSHIAGTYPTRERFLTDLALDPPQATSDEAGPAAHHDDYLILSTIHSAKGQEWKAVHVLNVVDGCMPSDLAAGSRAELEEERRLLYVAMTRARDHLDLMVPQRFHVTQQARLGDRHVYAARTRFIPDALLPAFDCTAWPVVDAADAHRVREPGPRVDLAARVRAAWR